MSVEKYSVQYKGYNLIGVTTVEKGDGSYDSTSLFWITYAFMLEVCTVILTGIPYPCVRKYTRRQAKRISTTYTYLIEATEKIAFSFSTKIKTISAYTKRADLVFITKNKLKVSNEKEP